MELLQQIRWVGGSPLWSFYLEPPSRERRLSLAVLVIGRGAIGRPYTGWVWGRGWPALSSPVLSIPLLATLLPAVLAPCSWSQPCVCCLAALYLLAWPPHCLEEPLPWLRCPAPPVSFDPLSKYILNLCAALHRSVLMSTVCLVIIVMPVGTSESVRWGK